MYPSDLNRLVLAHVLALGATLSLPRVAAAQGTAADYARAEKLRASYEALAVDIAGPATAIGRTHRFWYRKTVRGAEQFVVVDADTQRREPAFDHERVAESLSEPHEPDADRPRPAAVGGRTGPSFAISAGALKRRPAPRDSRLEQAVTPPRLRP